MFDQKGLIKSETKFIKFVNQTTDLELKNHRNQKKKLILGNYFLAALRGFLGFR